jgi:hypothetical protein
MHPTAGYRNDSQKRRKATENKGLLRHNVGGCFSLQPTRWDDRHRTSYVGIRRSECRQEEPASPAGMFAGLLTAAKMLAHAGDEIVHLAEKAGTSVGAISSLAYAARRAEVSDDSLAVRRNVGTRKDFLLGGCCGIFAKLSRPTVCIDTN